MKVKYQPPPWLVVVEAIISIALIVVGAVTLSTQQCGVSEFPFSANVWLIISGSIGLFYALYVFIFMAALLCVCLICCLVPVMILVLFLKILFYIAWAIVGIVMLSLGPNFPSTCPVVFAFYIVGVVFLLLDIFPTYKSTTIEQN